jgi:hypothetical protein
MYKQIAATAIALVLTLGLVSTAYAQQTNATGIQIQLVPEIQRGHNQHLTVFAVDDQGNQVNETITTQVTNEKGNPVGPGLVESESGDVLTYKVGPNTRPQNITVDSQINGADISASQDYYVFPKGQAQQPQPIPTPEQPANDTGTGTGTGSESENGTIPTPEPQPVPPVNETAPSECIPNANTNATGNAAVDINHAIDNAGCPEAPANNQTGTGGGNETGPVIIEPPTNQTEVPVVNETGTGSNNNTETPTPTPQPAPAEPEQPSANATQAFNQLENSTALLDQKLDEVLDNGNDTNRGELKAALDETAGAIGGTSGVIVNATGDQLLLLQNTFISGSEAIDEVLGNGDEEE